MSDITNRILGAFGFRGREPNGASIYYRKGKRAVYIGEGATASGDLSVAVGSFSNTQEDKSTAVGAYAKANGNSSTVVGAQSEARGRNNAIVGEGTVISGDDSTAVGQGVTISGNRSTLVGQGAQSNYDDCTVVGKGGAPTAAGQVIIGTADSTITKVFLGRGVTHTGAAQTTEVHAADGSGSNVAGDNLALYSGASTGNADSGTFSIYTAGTGSSGSSVNTNLPRVRISGAGQFRVLPLGTDLGAAVTAAMVVGPVNDSPPTSSVSLVDKTADGEAVALQVKYDSGDTSQQFAAVISERMSASGQRLPLVLRTRGSDGNFPRVGIGASDGGVLGGALGVVLYGASAAAPTGGTNGYMGVGTLNAAADLYKNGTAFTNPAWVFKKHFTGTSDTEGPYAAPEGYEGPMSLDAHEEYTRTAHDLPLMSLKPGGGIFDRGDMLLASLEEAYLYIYELHKRIKALEEKVK